MKPEILITFIVYMATIMLIGFIANRFNKNLSDYVLGGRRLGGAVAALGAGASDMSGWLLLGLPGAAYTMGVNQIWMPIGLSIGAFINWHYVAKRLRIYTKIARDSLTIPAFLDQRFNDHKRVLRIITAIVILVFFTGYAAAGFVSGAVLFQSMSGLSYEHALWIGAAFIMSYTCVGGFLAVSWVDFFQGTLMFIALILMPVSVIVNMGGWDQTANMIVNLSGTSAHLNVFSGMSFIGIVSLLAWGLGYFGQPHILVRFMAVKNTREIPKAKFICMTWMIIALYGAIFTGLAGYAYFGNEALAAPESVLLELANKLFNPWITGFFLAAVLSAVMSTVAAQLLVSSSALVEDFYHGFVRKKAGQIELVWVGRAMVVLIALAALLLAYQTKSSVLDLVSYAWAGMGASFGPTILFSLFWKRTTLTAVVWSIVVGALTVLGWKYCQSIDLAPIFQLYEIVPAFILASLTIVLLSAKKHKVPQEIQSDFNKMLEKEARV